MLVRLEMMVVEVTRLLLGLLIVLFHRPLANKVMQYERALDRSFRCRGFNLPAPLSDATAQNIYFAVGILICLLESARIWMAL